MKTPGYILLVEDEPVMRDLILLAFTQQFHQDFKIRSVKNGLEALEMIRQEMPNLVILDILLPQMNGLQLIQRLGDEQLLQDTQIIIISGLGFKEIVQQALEAGVRDFLVKPFKIDILVERARSLLGQAEVVTV
jgi:DNA-binding response OmpR family regulator